MKRLIVVTVLLISFLMLTLMPGCSLKRPVKTEPPVVQTPEKPAAEEKTADATVCPIPSPEEADQNIEDMVEPAPVVDEDVLAARMEQPFQDMTDEEIARLLKTEPELLGPMSVGYPNAGALVNGVPFPKGPYWEIINPSETYGTTETNNAVIRCINKVHEQFPDSHIMYIGDISDKDGGRLNRHLSHQAGRDIDVSYYYKNPDCAKWYAKADASNLDAARTWAFVRALFTETDVELILIDKRLQPALKRYAISIGEDREFLDKVFQYPNGPRYATIRHARGHATHIHIRFYNRFAQEMGRRAYPYLIKQKKIKPPTYYTYHKVRRGQTLGHLARRYGTSVSAIKRANGLRSNTIRAGRSYKIPKRGGVKPAPKPASIPPRWVLADPTNPPTKLAMTSAKARPTIGAMKTENGMVKVADAKTESLPDGNIAPVAAAPVAKPMIAPKPKPKKKVASNKKLVRYKVRSGDNLWTIARRHNVHVKDIKRWNGLKSNNLKPGQVLKIYVRRA